MQMSSCSRSAAAEAETVASEGGMVTVAEAMEKGVGVRGVGVKVVVTVTEEMAAAGMAAAGMVTVAEAMEKGVGVRGMATARARAS